MSGQSAAPKDDALQAHWRAALAESRLLLQECRDCGARQFYPRAVCASCWSDAVEWCEATGRGTIYSYTVARVPTLPQLAERVPYVIAIVELAEGPRMTTLMLDRDPESIHIGMPVAAQFLPDAPWLHFVPA